MLPRGSAKAWIGQDGMWPHLSPRLFRVVVQGAKRGDQNVPNLPRGIRWRVSVAKGDQHEVFYVVHSHAWICQYADRFYGLERGHKVGRGDDHGTVRGQHICGNTGFQPSWQYQDDQGNWWVFFQVCIQVSHVGQRAHVWAPCEFSWHIQHGYRVWKCQETVECLNVVDCQWCLKMLLHTCMWFEDDDLFGLIFLLHQYDITPYLGMHSIVL